MRGLAQFAVDFVLVAVGDKLVEELVGPDQFEDAVGSQEWHEAFLPVVVAAFDFAFGLGRWGVEELDAVEVEGCAELGEGVGVVSVKEGVVVHVEGQGQAVSLEDAGEEVEVGEEGFSGVEACASVEARGIVEDVQEDLFIGATRQPGVGCGVVLPEGPVVAGLPAFDGFWGGLVAGVGRELMFDRPAADAGAVGFEAEAAMEFAGDGTVGGRRLGGEKFGGQGGGFRRPARVVIPAGETGRPGFGAALSAGEQVVGAQSVKAAQADAQFQSDGFGRERGGAGLSQEMADQGCGKPMSELKFFMARKIAERWILRFGTDSGRRAGPAAGAPPPSLPYVRLQTALRLRPRRALSSAEARRVSLTPIQTLKQKSLATRKIPVLIAQTFPLLIAPRHS